MKRLLIIFFFLITIFQISAQQNIIADTVDVIKEIAIGSVYYSPSRGVIIYRNKDGKEMGSVDISKFYASRTDLNNLTTRVDSHSVYKADAKWFSDVYMGTQGDILELGWELIPGYNPNYYILPSPFDTKLVASNTYNTLLKKVNSIQDTLNWVRDSVKAHGAYIYAHSAPPTFIPNPIFTKWKDTLQFGTITNLPAYDTIRIGNTGNTKLTVYTNYVWEKIYPLTEVAVNPFVLNSFVDTVTVGSYSTMTFRFFPSAAGLYKYKLKVTHNGSEYERSKIDSFYLSGNYAPIIIPPTASDTANIYVSYLTGDDNNSGSTRTSPKKTIGAAIAAADTGMIIGLKAGETWNEAVIINKNGIKLRSYGSGAKPIVNTFNDIPNWSTGTWTNLGNNIWSLPLSGFEVLRLWIDGSEVEKAIWTAGNEYFGNGNHLFNHNTYDNVLYLYNESNPATSFSSIKFSGVKSPSEKYYTIYLSNANNVTLEGLDIRGGLRGSLGGGDSHNALIQDCSIGFNANRHGLIADGFDVGGGSRGYCNNWNINKDTIFSNWVYDYDFYDVSTPYGIFLKGENNVVDSCYIKDWWFGIYSAGYYNIISNNEITAPNWNFTKAIQLYPRSTDYWYQRNVVYNNFIHNVKAVGISCNSSGNKIYYNIIDSVLCSTLEGKDPSSPGCSNTGNGFEFTNDGDLGSSQIDSNYIFNNTIYHTDRAAYFSTSSPRYTTFLNNLMVNTRRHYGSPNVQAMEVGANTEITSSILRKNVHYNAGLTSSIFFISGMTAPYTVAGLNSAYPSNSIGNFYSTKTLVADLLTVNTWLLPSGSDALDAGYNISSLISGTFVDRFGNTVNKTQPNIGACDNNP